MSKERGRHSFRIEEKGNKVVLEFAVPILQAEFTVEQALILSKAILEIAQEITRKKEVKVH